ncbi:DNA mismatch repair protein MutT [Reichenbachiella sp. 5M10]|uniref:NUDIX hydrolase n=1 Tax=Reichenbachiella sp. 5M10 TaxID=1889772 RepID=UPI000C1609D7|nr:NUDIX domain-containing protein [Reichenbachiella sp. 5M10]PIB34699.1 DNA mismatch repair protein MutT [Reichenbachiella sp. 5M10]
MTLYKEYDRLLVAVDCIIFGFHGDKLKLLLIKRDFEPEKGKWSLMGGFAKKSESLDDAASRILLGLTGLQDVFLEQLFCFNQVDRDPVERTISVTYYSLINIEDHDEELSKQHDASWFDLGEMPDLIFDHNEMVDRAHQRLKYKAEHYPVGFELLPPKFTMPELQSLYEAIFETEMDKRNFIKRIDSLDILVKLNEKKRTTGKKGAFLYQFDEDKYQQQLKTGNKFQVKP